MDDKNVFVNVRLMTDDILGTAAANRKLSRKVRGLGGWVFGLVVTCVVLIAELAERKRCEKYLEEQIDDLKERMVSTEEEVANLGHEFYDHEECDHATCEEVPDGGACDAIDIQGQIDDLEDRVNDLTWTVKKLKEAESVPDGGACDA